MLVYLVMLGDIDGPEGVDVYGSREAAAEAFSRVLDDSGVPDDDIVIATGAPLHERSEEVSLAEGLRRFLEEEVKGLTAESEDEGAVICWLFERSTS